MMTKELIKIEGQAGITATGWDLINITEDQWKEAGEVLIKINKASQWWMGDWWNACPHGDGKKEAEAIGIEPSTAANCGRLCRGIPISRRRDELSPTHHMEVLRLSTESKQDEFLHVAVERGWTVKRLREEINKFKEFDDWTESELERKAQVEDGITVVANCKEGDDKLIQWAKDNKKYVFVGRSMHDLGWGNPYELDKDGTRTEVCEYYKGYLSFKFGLFDKFTKLKGKVLGCYCYPNMCHADTLAIVANGPCTDVYNDIVDLFNEDFLR